MLMLVLMHVKVLALVQKVAEVLELVLEELPGAGSGGADVGV